MFTSTCVSLYHLQSFSVVEVNLASLSYDKISSFPVDIVCFNILSREILHINDHSGIGYILPLLQFVDIIMVVVV